MLSYCGVVVQDAPPVCNGASASCRAARAIEPTTAIVLTRKFHIRQHPVVQHGRNAALSHTAPRLNA